LFITASTRIAIPCWALLAVIVALPAPSSAELNRRLLALPAPVLTSPGGKSHTDSYVVAGSVDTLIAGSWVRILRNGTVIDSVSAATNKQFSKRVPLLVGDNSLRAVLANGTSVSVGSNIVTVHFVTQAGFFMPVPMVPGASFDINPVETAAKVELRLFDTGGDLVKKFESRDARNFYSFPWDGKNNSYLAVKRGPLVAVVVIDYPDGTHDVIRHALLFDPQGSP
jgi:hypothetical protein